MDSTFLTSEIVGQSAERLAEWIAAGQVSSEEVVQAHIRRIEQVDGGINAVVIRLFERARAEARQADAAQRAGGPLGPLHGVPVTIKECFYVAGTDATIGVAHYVGRPTPEDGPLVRRLRQAGAIVLGKTNVPQLMMLHESDNPVYGCTKNPWDDRRGPGGSSGGEAAIVAAGGSPLGLGSDMGGSIRQPAHSCGVCGLKPTSGRLTNVGSRIFNPGMRQIAIQPGPLARRVEDLALAMRVLAPAGRADGQPDETPMPWPEYERLDIGEMRLGMWEDDGFLTPSPAIRRAVREAADALRRRGAEVDPVDPPDVHQMLRLYMGLASADGGEGMIRFLAGSPRDKRITKQLRLGRLPRLVKRPLAAALRMAGQGRSAEMLTAIGACSARAYWDLAAAQEQLRATFLERLAELRIDAILCPPHSLPALLHGDGMYLLGAATACYLPNLLGFPAGVLPATYVREGEESDRAPDRDFVGRLAARCEAGSAGLPVGVQVMGRPWREDIVLAVMHALQEGFRLPLRLP